MSVHQAERRPLLGACATAGCKEQHVHPLTGEPPDYHWVTNDGRPLPRWRNPYKSSPKPEDWWYRIHEIAKIAGVAEGTVRRWIQVGGLKASRQNGGRFWFVRGRDLNEYLLQQPRVAVPVRA